MSSLEPTDVGPAVGGDRLVSDADRQHVVTLLTAAHAEGRLTVDERDRRLGEAQRAEIFDDLVPLTRDLVTAPTGAVTYTTPSTDQSDRIVAVFGGAERAGHWSVRAHTTITAMFGGVELDLSEAVFESNEITIEVFCLFGGVELKVPDGTSVDNRLNAVFGGCDHKVGPPSPDAPRLTVKGFAGFGGVDVRNLSNRTRRRRERHRDRHRSY